MKHIIAVAACVLAGGALAACPGPGALETGIAVTLTDGSVETFRAIGPGRVENYTDAAGTGGNYNILAQGLYLRATSIVESGAVDTGSQITYNFPMPDNQMPIPTPGGAWSVEVTVLDAGQFDTEFHDVRFGQTSRYTLGACSYDMIPVVIRIGDSTDWVEETLYWLPELGVSLYAKYEAKDEAPEIYRYVSIAAMDK